jgi:hypothetical protein
VARGGQGGVRLRGAGAGAAQASARRARSLAEELAGCNTPRGLCLKVWRGETPRPGSPTASQPQSQTARARSNMTPEGIRPGIASPVKSDEEMGVSVGEPLDCDGTARRAPWGPGRGAARGARGPAAAAARGAAERACIVPSATGPARRARGGGAGVSLLRDRRGRALLCRASARRRWRARAKGVCALHGGGILRAAPARWRRARSRARTAAPLSRKNRGRVRLAFACGSASPCTQAACARSASEGPGGDPATR